MSWRLEGRVLVFGPFRLEVDQRLLRRNGDIVPLAPKEFETLLALAESGGGLLSKEALIARVWPDTFVTDSSLARNISVLRKALGNDIIQTTPKVGYRLTLTVTEQLPEAEQPSIEPAVNPAEGKSAAALSELPDSKASAFARNLAIYFLLPLAIIAIASLWVHGYSHVHPASDHSPRHLRIVVLPFQNFTGNPQDDYLCDGLTEALISEFARLDTDKLGVIARTSAMHYKQTSETVPQIARNLRVDYVVESSVRGSGSALQITTQLVRGRDASHLWTGEYERHLTDVLGLERSIAVAIAQEIDAKLVPAPGQETRSAHRVDPDAYRYYQLGRMFLEKRNRQDNFQALEYFRRALQLDPQYARAYAGLADTYLVMGAGYMKPLDAYTKASAAAQHALALDHSIAEAYTALGYEKFINEWDWTGAQEDYEKAIALQPGDAEAHHWYAIYLEAMHRSDEAIEQIKLAMDLDPLSLPISQNAGFIYIQAGRYPEAVSQLQHALEIDPHSSEAYGYLGLAYEYMHQYPNALQAFRRAQQVAGDPTAYASDVGEVEALMGNRGAAYRVAQQLLRHRRDQNFSACPLALLYATLGERKPAFQWLRRAVEDRSCTATEINNAQQLDGLRSAPDFALLKRELKLP